MKFQSLLSGKNNVTLSPLSLSFISSTNSSISLRQHSFLEIDHEIFSTVILSLQLIQEGQLSVSG